ncbi:MAG: helix-hairpin-helix domain-containing protein [Bacillus sp. (in: Bacteria)]|nr:helix-hairpin-helix domain-containing protein [Bacillus sp. (in: firmicutes)]
MDNFLLNTKWKLVTIGVFCFLVGAALVYFLPSGTEKAEEPSFFLPWEEEGTGGDMGSNGEVSTTFYIDVKGEVVFPGLYEMESGERVFHAIERAGGFTKEAEQNLVNLAEKCYDEMVIYVPSKLDVEVGGGVVFQGNILNEKDGLIHVNRASAEELTKLPGIGPAKADAIIRYREENGPFQQMEELVKVPGIGAKTLENIRDMIKIP